MEAEDRSELGQRKARTLDWSRTPLVMGIINVTPDSFYPASRTLSVKQAREAALRMISQGADILDIGGESTRPGAEYLPAEEEIERIVPVIEAVRKESGIFLSVDTRKARTAEAALDAGADIINDVSALTEDPMIAPLTARRGVQAILMHKRGIPADMQDAPRYEDTVGEIREELRLFAEKAEAAGVAKDRIILDPGIGFGKRVGDNYRIIAGLSRIKELGYPVMVGLSRKSFIGAVTGRDVGDRLDGTIVMNTVAVLGGADILRVHDVAAAVDLGRLLRAMKEAEADV